VVNNKCINKRVPSRTKAEWYFDNKADQSLKKKKKKYEQNKEKVKQRVKHYADKNRETILAKNKITYKCTTCFCTVTKPNKSRHEKSFRHKLAEGIIKCGSIEELIQFMKSK
jgi:hypothetical protein